MNITKEQVRAAIADGTIEGDGHTIFAPEKYTAHFDVSHLVQTLRSDGTHKGTIFVDGEPVSQLEGVYNLTFLTWLINTLGLPHSTAMGRGFAARDMVRTLTEWANNE